MSLNSSDNISINGICGVYHPIAGQQRRAMSLFETLFDHFFPSYRTTSYDYDGGAAHASSSGGGGGVESDDVAVLSDNATNLVIAGGQIEDFFLKFWGTTARLKDWDLIVRHLSDTVHVTDFVVLFVLGWLSVPFFGLLYYSLSLPGATAPAGGVRGTSTTSAKPYKQSYMYFFADHMSQIARIGIVIYIVDCLVVIMSAVECVPMEHLGKVSKEFAKVLIVTWLAFRFSKFKTYLLFEQASPSFEKHRATVINGLIDALILVFTVLTLVDVLEAEFFNGIGVSKSTVFAIGSASTIVIGLASREMAAMLIAGLNLTLSDRLQVGNEVNFGDGKTSGFIQKIGWFQTTIRGYNEIISVIPNNELGNQRVKNISRCPRCQVKEVLRVRHEDADKLPGFLVDVLEEIKSTCQPDLILQGRPFRAMWIGYGEDHLKVMIDTHHNIKPTGQKYWETRQKVMFSIHRALKKHDIKLVTTRYPFKDTVQKDLNLNNGADF